MARVRKGTTGAGADYDPRITAARADLAAKHLEGRLTAKHFVEGTGLQVASPVAPLHRRPDFDSTLDTELLMGEGFIVYEVKDGWAWGQAEIDSYVGYVPAKLLSAPPDATHRVSAITSHLYNKPVIHALTRGRLSLGCRVHVVGQDGRFVEVTTQGGARFVPAAHIAPIGTCAPDYVTVAERFIGVPYVWGGRTSAGIDCSALVQLALAEAGIAAPRDSDLQRAALGKEIAGNTLRSLERGDLLFWEGHVAIATDERRIVHANATAMAVSIDDAAAFAHAAEAAAGPVLAVKRL